MKSQIKWIAVPVLLLLVFAGWKIVATADTFAPGTSVDKWKIGGLTEEEARSLLLQKAQAKPLRISGVKSFNARVVSRPLVQDALERARSQENRNIWNRLLGNGSAHVVLRWKYNKARAKRVFQRALRQERAPRNALVRWQGLRVQVVPGRSGWIIRRKALRKEIQDTARAGGGVVAVSGRRVAPLVRGARDLWKKTPTQLLVDQSDFTLYYYRHGRLQKQYPVAVGMPGFETPNGYWKILDRTVDPAWMPPEWAGAQAGILVPGGAPGNPLIDRWMGIGDGVGIHGTTDIASLGSQASHGCIRMDPADVRELYENVPVGTPFLIRS